MKDATAMSLNSSVRVINDGIFMIRFLLVRPGHVTWSLRFHFDSTQLGSLHGHCPSRPVVRRWSKVQNGHHRSCLHLGLVGGDGFAGRHLLARDDILCRLSGDQGRQRDRRRLFSSQHFRLHPVSSGIRT